MTRSIDLTFVAAAMLFVSLSAVPEARAQQPPMRVDLDQALLDRWLVAMPQIIKLGKSSTALQSDGAARPHMERICAEARFENYDRCAEVIGYVGMIVSACDRRSRTFRDLIVMMRREIARIESKSGLTSAERDKATTEMKQIVMAFPDNFPQAHIRLMTANRDRIFAVLAQSRE